jgi:uncharacterized NAD(P)/FAD-binding protein YdhS
MRLAIVGGGAAAVAMLDALARCESGVPTRIIVFEPAARVGPGRPYRPDPDGSLINRPADRMSIRSTEPLDFQHWLRRKTELGHYPTVDPAARFQPRWLFGEYLDDRFARAVNCLTRRCSQVEVHRTTVVDLCTTHGQLVTITATGEAIGHDRLVLCLGTPRPADVYGLTGQPGFVADPYPLTESLPAREPVIVLGSNLSAVDVAVALLRRGHVAPIRLMSRTGLLPSVRCRPAPIAGAEGKGLAEAVRHTPRAQLWPTVRRGLRDRLVDHNTSLEELALDLSVAEPAEARLHRQLRRIEAQECWRAVLLPLLDPVGELLWQRLPLRTRQVLLSRYNTRIASVLNPMPPATAALLLSALHSGAVEVHAGTNAVTPRPGGGFTVTAAGREHSTSVLFNAVRATRYDPEEPAGRLLARLATRKLAREHPCGGVYIDFATNRVLGPARGLYALGHPTSGDIYYANAGSLLGISARADRIAAEIQRCPPSIPSDVVTPVRSTNTATALTSEGPHG